MKPWFLKWPVRLRTGDRLVQKKQSLYLQTAKPCNNNNKVCVSLSRPSTKCYELVHRLTVP